MQDALNAVTYWSLIICVILETIIMTDIPQFPFLDTEHVYFYRENVKRVVPAVESLQF